MKQKVQKRKYEISADRIARSILPKKRFLQILCISHNDDGWQPLPGIYFDFDDDPFQADHRA